MEPLAAMAKQLAAALNQAAESFASVKKELAETKAALAQTKKKALEDSIASIEQREENIRQASEIISLIRDTHYEAGQRLLRHSITIDNTYGDAMYSARYHSTTELEKNTFRWTTENREAAIELDELLLQLDKMGPIIETEPESA
ncbi:hypothetical protein D6C86_04596 [Aureobasidium pullulans]|uniref:Uncharacterized protein n=1 Tax=Aureobasidium pullulans TaxID=5580 RepID=A0A4S9YPG1_AURPU|nr:hypothetical protein D6C94_07454 [Aureobasidium pullulans]THZ43658.1 hypothetical protein D6C87_04124 [Aureobasidium pullulans]THZ61086.1 hypothetical protein D6C86_04596 [Aureobasidium pullulans]THZ93803.1 hypothetical protein D6C88_02586 [Aureobasidium pullulans]